MANLNDSALIIIDVQERLLSVISERDKLVKNISVLAQAAELLKLPVIWCQQYPKALGQTAAEVSKYLKTEPINKMCFNACLHEEFASQLKLLNVKNLVLCGIESHICVYQTAKELLRLGYNVEVVQDAVSSRSIENKKTAIQRMRDEGVSITSVEMALFELLETAEHSCFKQISKLIK